MQNIFFINTPDPFYYKRAFLKVARTFPKETRPLSIFFFDGEKNTIREISEELSTPSFASPQKIVTIERYDKLVNKPDFNRILDALHENVFVFFLKETSKTPSQLGDFIKKNRSRVLEINVYEVTFDTLKTRICDFLKENDISFDPPAVETYALFFENQDGLLEKELEKVPLYLYKKPERRFTMNLVKELLSVSEFFSLFKVGSAILNRNKKKSLVMVRKFLYRSPGDFIALQAYLTGEVKKILFFKRLKEEKLAEKVIFSKLGVTYPKAQESLADRASRFSEEDILLFADHLGVVELLLKSTSFNNEDVDKVSLNQKAYAYFVKALCFITKDIL